MELIGGRRAERYLVESGGRAGEDNGDVSWIGKVSALSKLRPSLNNFLPIYFT